VSASQATGLGNAKASEPSGLGPTGAIPRAKKRNWRGQFVKSLRHTPDGSREWLIWSHYHSAWHRRSKEGDACGYTADIARAGLFDRAKADEYNNGERNEAFHISEKLPLIKEAIRQHNEALERLHYAHWVATEKSND
jgi:hypothetical protein